MRRWPPLVLVVALLAGCGGGDAASSPVAETATAGGPSVPRAVVGEEYPGARSTLGGTTRLAGNGCWHLTMPDGEAMIVFPTGSELGDNGDVVDLPGGASVPAGAAVEGTATLVPAGQLPGGPDGYWGYITGYCDAEQAVVFEDLRVVGSASSS